MTARSAGILLYRRRDRELQVFLAHPGGPYWAHKDLGAWTIPKGEYPDSEEPLQAARREFLEETGFAVEGPFIALDPVRQTNGKIVSAWAAEGEIDPTRLRSNLFSIEWPPQSGKMQQFPEVDRGAWFLLEQARVKMIAAQVPLLDQLMNRISYSPP
jgi:predicted NUDIX family NTP pyrophosphohydrolase